MANLKELGRGTTSTFALANRPRATRAMVAKVRTGCITCKRRHVKCDETKPACQRCIKWRGQCDGYEDPRSHTRSPDQGSCRQPSSSPTEHRVTGPKWFRSVAIESHKLVTQPQDIRESLRRTAQSKKQTEEEKFAEKTSSFDDEFWQTTAPQLLMQNTAVWYASLAIHALVDSKRPTLDEEGGGQPSDAYRRALKYHGLALGQLRKEPISRCALQSATLCCLFFVIFEILNGDEQAAQAHMYNGCKMMDEIQRNATGQPMTNVQVDAMLQRELRRALRFMAGQVNRPASNQKSTQVQEGSGTPGDRSSSVSVSSTFSESAASAWYFKDVSRSDSGY